MNLSSLVDTGCSGSPSTTWFPCILQAVAVAGAVAVAAPAAVDTVAEAVAVVVAASGPGCGKARWEGALAGDAASASVSAGAEPVAVSDVLSSGALARAPARW